VSATTTTTPISIKAIPSIARTTVRFEITPPEAASIAIYDIEGRRLKFFSPYENLVWDVSSVPSGFYTVILRSKGAIAVTKIEVIK
ncbi:MAG TPA: T9SS type A sorting domain-containing protein, partial [Candidatus Kapabacteria bacterium]|nr:T9SS type A sorting domain-containing protein [Candidatus Kapabacteria bacterium]